MSRALIALAKVARFEGRTLQRRIAEVDREADAARDRARARLEALDRESAAAAGDPFLAAGLSAFTAAERGRAAEELAQAQRLADVADGLRTELAIAFAETKKLETLLDSQADAARREADRRAQIEADERAVRRR